MGVPAGNTIPAIPAEVLAVNGEVLGKLGDDEGIAAELPLVELLRNGAGVQAESEASLLPGRVLATRLGPQELLVIVDDLQDMSGA